MKTARERYLAKGKKRGPKSPAVAVQRAKAAPVAKTHITPAEFSRLAAIIREAEELTNRQNALIDEAMRITGEHDPCGWTFDAIVVNQRRTAGELVRLAGLTMKETP